MVKYHVVDVHITPPEEKQQTSLQNIERIANSHDYLWQDFSHVLKNKCNYSQNIFMLNIRGVSNSIMDLNIWSFTKSTNKDQLQNAINTTRKPQVPIWGSETKIKYKRWTRVWDEMVLVKMLVEIDPLPMRGSLVMTLVMISPSRREVS